MSLSNIVDKFHNKNGFSYTSTTKQPNLPSPLVWCKQVNNLYEMGVKSLYICTQRFKEMGLMHLQLP